MAVYKFKKIFKHGNHYFFLKQEIVANGDSDYAGLQGVITEISVPEGNKADAAATKITCDFELPENKLFQSILAKRFEMSAEYIPLHDIALTPELIEPKAAYQVNLAFTPVYVLSNYSDDDSAQDDGLICASTDFELLKSVRDRLISENKSFMVDGDFSLDGFEVLDFIQNDTVHIWSAENDSQYINYTIEQVTYLGAGNGGN
jgi:hypothetical protein